MEWVRGETLGHGSFATVSLAKPRKQSPHLPHLMAVKSCGASHSSSLINEAAILRDLSGCDQVIRCFGSDFSFQNGEKLCNLLLEYASGGSLSDKMRRSGHRNLPEFELQRYTRSILKGVSYIHKRGYVHCDVKPQNILLLCSENGRDEVAKIADFGLAKRAGSRGDKFELKGTPMYMSPEMAAAGEQEAPADIWALGCLVTEMTTGVPVWRFPAGADMAQLLMMIGAGDEVPQIPEVLSDDGKDFLGKCFIRDPEKRWTAEMLLHHPFIVDQTDHVRIDVAPDNCSFGACSSSPRCPFDFLDFENSSCEITSLPVSGFDDSTLAMERVRGLACDHVPDWPVADGWVTLN